MTNKTTFWAFLKDNDIEIPIIQRDYAQGRPGKENLRKSFLGDLKKALDAEHGEMKLDFVYGSSETGKLYPLDGQQRLTTLWLLHWYIALRAGILNKENCMIFKRFTYETRISSREFCHNLCESEHFINFDGNNIVDFIKKQTWFYSVWKQDPTIQSMLRMLGGTEKTKLNGENIVDGIEKMFSCPVDCDIYNQHKCALVRQFESYWQKLSCDNCPIVFYYLPLNDFGLSDDLYLKMNARGKQLTCFENFKADLIGYIYEQSRNEKLPESNRYEWIKLIDPTNGIPIKLDTSWTHIFWGARSFGIKDSNEKKIKENQIDEIYFVFFNRLFWNYLFISKKENNEDYLRIGEGIQSDGNRTRTIENENQSYRYLNSDNYYTYTSFDPYKYKDNSIPIDFFIDISCILDRYSRYSGEFPVCKWNKEFRFIPEYSKDKQGQNVQIENESKEKVMEVKGITQVQRVVFFAICKYFKEGEGDGKTLKRWMRVVWNLVSGETSDGGPQIRSTEAMRTAIKFIDNLDSHAVYESLIKVSENLIKKFENTNIKLSDFESRCIEEIIKANQIINDDGSLRIYDGTSKRKDGSVFKTWEDIIIEAEECAFFKGSIRFLFINGDRKEDWTTFDKKYENANVFFKKDSSNDYPNTIELAKYFEDKDVEKIWWSNNFDKRGITWKMLLLSKNYKQIHCFMLKQHVSKKTILIEDIENLITKINDSLWIRDWNTDSCYLTNYDKQVSVPENGYVYMIGNRKRNEIINKIKDISQEIKFQNGYRDSAFELINDVYYYRGLKVDFIYKDHFFRLWENNTICEMTDDWCDKKNTLYFAIDNMDIGELANQLDAISSNEYS